MIADSLVPATARVKNLPNPLVPMKALGYAHTTPESAVRLGERGVSLPRHRKSSLLDLRTFGGEIG